MREKARKKDMKSEALDFAAIKAALREQNINIRQICIDLYMQPNLHNFVMTPDGEKTPSLRLYPTTDSFYDFSSGNGGDGIRLLSYVRHISDHEAAELLCDYYHLDIKQQDDDTIRRIRQERERKALIRERRNREFHDALFDLIGELKNRIEKYTEMLKNPKIRPLDSLWCFLIQEIEAAEYKLDILCASDCSAYRRMKPDKQSDMPSSRPVWMMDVLQILGAAGRFAATAEEMEQIRRQISIEARRKPHVRTEGRRRSC